jgi:hypothetical protein
VLSDRRTEHRFHAKPDDLVQTPPQSRAVELRAAQQMLMQFARLKSSEPVESSESSLIDPPTLARHYQCVFARESQVRLW